jgi:hypothetical protein
MWWQIISNKKGGNLIINYVLIPHLLNLANLPWSDQYARVQLRHYDGSYKQSRAEHSIDMIHSFFK